MCGIAGIAGQGAGKEKKTLRSMRDILAHRGPDDFGEYFDDMVALGHRRLSIIDLHPRGKNPMISSDGRFVIIYNGEVFNYKEIKDEIGDRYSFKTTTDTEVVLAAYVLWGDGCVNRFIGMFAFAIWDKKEQKLFCSRDRFGIKPFYYVLRDSRFYFASEIKSLFQASVKPRPNMSIIYDYLKWGIYDHSEETFYEGIIKLNPGHTLVWKNGKVSISKYWDINEEIIDDVISDLKLSEMIWEKFDDAVKLALRADVPLGVNLSGGFDSSLLLALIDKHVGAKSRLEGFTQDYSEQAYSERKWVVEMAKSTKRKVTFCLMDEKRFLDNRLKMLWYQDEPYAGVPVVSYASLYQSADRRNVKVLLDGNGVDEYFCGYRRYHKLFIKQLAEDEDGEYASYLAGYAREWGISQAQAVEEVGRQELNNAPGLMSAIDGTKSAEDSWLSESFTKPHDGRTPQFPRPYKCAVKNSMYHDIKYMKIPRALRFNDRVSMAFSKELRVPFLDHRLVEIGMSIPVKKLIANGRPKGLLRETSLGKTPDEVRLAPKRSVQTPQSEWFSSTLRSYLGDIFHSESFKNRGVYDFGKAIDIFNSLQGKRLENSFFLWQAAHIEEWFRITMDSNMLEDRPDKFSGFDHDEVNYVEE